MPLPVIAGFLLLIAAPQGARPPADVRSAFEEGNRRYAEGDYTTALERYDEVLRDGWASGALYYNTAGAHYRLGHTGPAVQYYEKARRLLPENERIQHNLSVVRSQIEAPPPARRSFLAATSAWLAAWAPPAVCLALGLLVYLAGLAWWVYGGAAARKGLWPAPRPAMLLVAGLLVAGLGLLLSGRPAGGRAVVLQGPLTLRSTPAARADSTAALPEGTVLRLTARHGAWHRVRSSRGDEGWAQADALGAI